jgi:hypothetical protein
MRPIDQKKIKARKLLSDRLHAFVGVLVTQYATTPAEAIARAERLHVDPLLKRSPPV